MLPAKSEVVEIDFHGESIQSIQVNGVIYVSIARLCENLGIDPSRQREKIQNDPKFNPRHMSLVATDGKVRKAMCLSETDMHGWLFSINSKKVHKDVREKLLLYQRECAAALTSYWRGQTIGRDQQVPERKLLELDIWLDIAKDDEFTGAARAEAKVEALQILTGRHLSNLLPPF